MDPRVQSLIAEIEALSEAERQALAREVRPLLLSTRAGLEEIDGRTSSSWSARSPGPATTWSVPTTTS